MKEETLRPWEKISCRAIEELIRTNLETVDKRFGEIATIFVANGYYLRRQRDEEMYVAAGYNTFEDYVKEIYGRSRSWAKRMIQINEKFSEGGNSPLIDSNFVSYSVSQLQEMLYLSDEQLEQVTPEMTVKEIRGVKKAEEKISPIKRGCITGKNPYGTCACCGNDGVECCAQCKEDCNSRCGWLEEEKEDAVPKTRENCQFDNTHPCTIDGAKPVAESLGLNCIVDCCSKCNKDCGARCNPSVERIHKRATSHTEETKDEAWFVKEYMKRRDKKTLDKLMQICRENKVDADKAKAIQEYLSPYGASYFSSDVFSYDFHEFRNGIDFKADRSAVRLHMKYGRFVKELLKLYDPFAPEFQEQPKEEQIPGQMEIYDYPETLPTSNVEASQENTCATSHTEETFEEAKKEQTETVIIESPEAKIHKTNKTDDMQQSADNQEIIVEGEYREVQKEKYEETTEKSDMELLEGLLKKENEMLSLMREEFADNDIRVRKAKIKVTALASMLCDLKLTMETELEEIEEQPVLPRLKNNEERKKFIENYATWPVWFEVPEASEIYHKYDLPDGSSLVICEYCWYSEWQKKTVSSTREYLLMPRYKYLQDCKSCQSELIEHLKNVQKGAK